MNKNRRKPFCYAPWMSLQYGSLLQGGGFSPCCESQWRAYNGSFDEYSKSDELNRFKAAMITHNTTFIESVCEQCINLEKVSGSSTRTNLIKKVEHENVSYEKIHVVDYRPTNICNLKCRMCFPSNSSMIAKERGITIDNNNVDDIYSVDFENVKIINLVGGEPSIDEHTDKFLQWLITNKNRDLRLSITTNATNTNSRWIDKLKEFKEVIVNVSIDGTEKTYEYIRTNAHWESVRNNIDIYKSLFETKFQITGSMYNMPNIEDWLPWFLDSNMWWDLYPVEGHKQLSLAALPDDIREEKIAYLQSLNNEKLESVINQFANSKFDPVVHKRFVDYTNKLDETRNTNIRTVSSVYERIMND